MDVVLREHIAEIASLPSIEVTGIIVTAAQEGGPTPSEPWPGWTQYFADASRFPTARQRMADKLRHLLRGGFLQQYGFCCEEARRRIKSELRRSYDLIIADHAQNFANFSPHDLRAVDGRTIFISHDVSYHAVLDAARLNPSRIARLYGQVQAIQAFFTDLFALWICSQTVFLSDWDQRYFAKFTKRATLARCPSLTASRPAVGPSHEEASPREVVFIGGPGFAPNRFAIQWLIGKLAPELAQLAPDLVIVLVGKGTEKIPTPNNVEALGFVPDDALAALLGRALCVISPVVHGSGIKIKLLEAFAAGCPVLATEQSLRGFDFMGISPSINLDRPDLAAGSVADLAANPDQRSKVRQATQATWRNYQSKTQHFFENLLCLDRPPAT
jgi:glycosyltransferase involved in cell wall biosynthesis